MESLLDAARDFAGVAVMLVCFGLWTWWDMMRDERLRREWLRINNWPRYVDLYCEIEDGPSEDVAHNWPEGVDIGGEA